MVEGSEECESRINPQQSVENVKEQVSRRRDTQYHVCVIVSRRRELTLTDILLGTAFLTMLPDQGGHFVYTQLQSCRYLTLDNYIDEKNQMQNQMQCRTLKRSKCSCSNTECCATPYLFICSPCMSLYLVLAVHTHICLEIVGAELRAASSV